MLAVLNIHSKEVICGEIVGMNVVFIQDKVPDLEYEIILLMVGVREILNY